MYNEPTDSELEKIPRLYSTEEFPSADIIIHAHFFIGGCDWYIAEYDPEKRLFFGYVILGDDYVNAEWGYISLDELCEVRTPKGFEIDRDLYWKPRKAKDVERIKSVRGEL